MPESTSTTSSYTNVSTHAQPLASGRILAPGGEADLALDNDHDKTLVEGGALAPTDTKAEKKEPR